MKRIFFAIIIALMLLGFNASAFAEKLVILYTGETHASLYPCHCPIEPFGGVARRATKIKELRKQFPQLLLLDSGGFFAGGVQDMPEQSQELQKKRTDTYLSSLKMMGYDALAIGNDEFNLGREFLQAKIKEAKIPFLSSNARIKPAQEFIIKQINGIKIGIIGVTPDTENIDKAVKISEPQISLKNAIDKLKAKKVNLIVVLSHLGEEKDKELIKNVQGIDILISGGLMLSADKFTKIDDTILLRPVWQARKLGRIDIELKDKKIANFNVEQLPLGADVPDDPEVKSILPVCFSDYDCLKPNFVGICNDAAEINASCAFEEIKKLSLLVIKPKNCRTCFTDGALNNIRRYLPNIEVKYLNFEDGSARKLIDNLAIKMLPAYILESGIEKDRSFPVLKGFLEKNGDHYYFKPFFTGVSYFVNRQFQKNKLDLFILLSDRQSATVLGTLKAFQNKMAKKINLKIHFLVIYDKVKGFVSPGGMPEIEEAKRSVCVMKYHPDKIWDYLICRAKDIQSSWWDKCLAKAVIKKIKLCATSDEADNLLRQNLKLTQELEISDTPVILLNNQEVFGVTPETSVEELEKIIEGKIPSQEQIQ